MAYVKKDWLDQNVQFPKRYTVSRVAGAGSVDDGDAIEMDTNFGIETEVGTDILATFMNNIEVGVESLNNGDALYVLTTGSANTYIATFSPTYTALTTGLTLRATFNVENTGASTFKLDSLTTEDLKKLNGTGKVDVEAGDIVAGTYIIVYDGTDWVITNQFKVKPMIQVFTASGTFNAPFTGNYKVTVIGGGGSGGSASPTTTGGGSGGCAIKVVTLTKNVGVTVTIGAGGTGVTANSIGNNGGTSSFVGHCDASGGIAGAFSTSQIYVNGGVGGLGSTGDLNLRGNRADFVQGNTGVVNGYGASSILGGSLYDANSYGCGSDGGTSTSNDGQDGIVIVEWMEG